MKNKANKYDLEDFTTLPTFKKVKILKKYIEFHLSDGVIVKIPLYFSEILLKATPEQRKNVELSPHFAFWNDIDEIIGVKNLFNGSMIPKNKKSK